MPCCWSWSSSGRSWCSCSRCCCHRVLSSSSHLLLMLPAVQTRRWTSWSALLSFASEVPGNDSANPLCVCVSCEGKREKNKWEKIHKTVKSVATVFLNVETWHREKKSLILHFQWAGLADNTDQINYYHYYHCYCYYYYQSDLFVSPGFTNLNEVIQLKNFRLRVCWASFPKQSPAVSSQWF